MNDAHLILWLFLLSAAAAGVCWHTVRSILRMMQERRTEERKNARINREMERIRKGDVR